MLREWQVAGGHRPLIDPDGEFAFLAMLAVMATGAVVAGALDATCQGIQTAENPARRAQAMRSLIGRLRDEDGAAFNQERHRVVRG